MMLEIHLITERGSNVSNLKLNQAIALLKGAKADAESAFTEMYHRFKKPALFTGISRVYNPREDGGEQLPAEGTKLQLRAAQELAKVKVPLARLLDRVATLDAGNQGAKANVVIDDQVILADVPVVTLLALEKKLGDFRHVLSTMPVLDPEVDWQLDEANRQYRAPEVRSIRTKKLPRNHVKAEATDKHPAQVEVYYEDAPVGDWVTTRFSGAISAARQEELLAKVSKLQEAVKKAREEANMTEVADVKIGDAVFAYLDW